MKVRLIGFWLVFVLAGCGGADQDIKDSHHTYLSSFGWTVDSKVEETTETLRHAPEQIENYRIAGMNFSPYQGKDAVITTYLLKDKQENGDEMRVEVYEVEGEIIGGFGILEGWDPGLFSMDDRERLVRDGIMR
ncbi:DUF4830 domain-containing protein [Rossellomorea aquimaris]|uniref:DUF4830 domain-containing protein n=1 Tax=Rossellomorea aquimaris TaxID=189382 RepID=UPI001CFD5D5E|nr:DUF4830 domain-containing protein [Rossellomorea aquimaris]